MVEVWALKKLGTVSNFSVNGSSNNEDCRYTIGFSEDFVCNFYHIGNTETNFIGY